MRQSNWPIERRLRLIGKIILICAVLFFFGQGVLFNDSSGYHEDEPWAFYSAFWIMGAVLMSCFFFWWASCCDPKE
jgi:hypothetical protein